MQAGAGNGDDRGLQRVEPGRSETRITAAVLYVRIPGEVGRPFRNEDANAWRSCRLARPSIARGVTQTAIPCDVYCLSLRGVERC